MNENEVNENDVNSNEMNENEVNRNEVNENEVNENEVNEIPAAGISAKKGAKNAERRKSSPHTIVLRPVLAPALMPVYMYSVYTYMGICI